MAATIIDTTGFDGEAAMPIETGEAAGLAELLQALGDPTRLRILSALDTSCVPVGSIVAATGLRQPSVSHHLRVLRDRGIVRAERRGAYVFYCAASDRLRPAIDAARALLDDRASR
jgi:ArsR family transcriptional regulator